jgi:mono/diheme cytochrome c family protein
MSVVLHAAAAWARESRAATPHQDYNSGEYLYRVFCASCHGGAGDGSVAAILHVPPADLTAIARRNARQLSARSRVRRD